MTHSELPWRHCAVKGGWDGVKDADGTTMLSLVANIPENATFITTACNEYDTLKAKAELFDDLVKTCRLLFAAGSKPVPIMAAIDLFSQKAEELK